jgi:ketosteroid isomerase-like protein
MMNGVLVLLAVSALSQTPKAEAADSKDSEAMSRLEAVWNEAHMKGDAAALDRLWAGDLVVTVPGMPAMSKTQSLAVWKSGKFKFDRYESSDVKTKVFGDAAVATGRMQRARTFGDRKMEDDWLFTKVYVRDKDGWKVVAFHASQAPQGKK